MRTVLFAGGGTGGTVGPGIAIAERLRALDSELAIRFLCSDRSVDRRLLDPGAWSATPTPARSPSIRPAAAWQFLRGWRGTRRIAGEAMSRGFRGRVVALGGFVAPPVVAEARTRGVPVDLLNLDAVPGRANRWIAARAERVFTAVDADLTLDRPPIGMPLRRCSLPSGDAGSARTALDLDADRRTLLVTGASQGARSIDRFVERMIRERPEAFEGWQVIHLVSGESDRLQAGYRRAGVRATVRPFLQDMGVAWAAADLAISRGGASSIAEIAASGTPAIVLPYPWHADRHQAQNAEPLRRRGAVEVLDDPVDGSEAETRLARALMRLLTDPAALSTLREAFPTVEGDPAETMARSLLEALEVDG
ncbi:MAG: UDP-N-acetylglucosamine--N-acetylmuramyl-(pentapeptide) pyrophosphoryl-undecaprenol N-acetylglucosamine transferase [Planctomycetota bacterium]|nr:UDP-N-acetylglucosamine--N-acetylmuramyl-(pentapeptide) pyrophosphoryl-undecaprenol N-acetylglucosamine transferase [Planctomycetota bacterium]